MAGYKSGGSPPSITRDNSVRRLHSILSNDHGGHPTRGHSTQSIRFGKEIYTIPEPPSEECPEFDDEKERVRSLRHAMELAEAALTEDDIGSDERVAKASGPCFACCGTPDTSRPGVEEIQLTEDALEKMSSRNINHEIERLLAEELSRGISVVREGSFQVEKGIVSFSSFLIAKRTKRGAMVRQPVPLVDYLPPSPFFTFDGKIGVDCKAFKLDFTDKLHNIIPPFFMNEAEANDERIRDTLQQGISFAREIDMFRNEDIEFLQAGEEPSVAHKDLLHHGAPSTTG